MKKLLFLAPLLISSAAMAQQFKVEKVKGNKAVIEFSGGGLTQGHTYNVSQPGDEELGSSPRKSGGGTGSRQYVVSGSFSFGSGTTSTSTTISNVTSTTSSNTTSMNFVGRFGWNMGTFELGPLVAYTKDTTSTNDSSTMSFGAFGDYNFTPNRPGESTIFALTAEGMYASNSTNSVNSSGMGLFAGGSLKWFGLTDSTAVRFDLGYNYQKLDSGSGTNATLQGFVGRAGIATYF